MRSDCGGKKRFFAVGWISKNTIFQEMENKSLDFFLDNQAINSEKQSKNFLP